MWHFPPLSSPQLLHLHSSSYITFQLIATSVPSHHYSSSLTAIPVLPSYSSFLFSHSLSQPNQTLLPLSYDMNKRRLAFRSSDDDSFFSDDDSWADGDNEEVVLADALWPDQPHLNQLMTVDCGGRGSFDVPLGCLDRERWATAFTGTAHTVSTISCMSSLASWTNVISLTFLQAWAVFILAHHSSFERGAPCPGRLTLAIAAAVLRHRDWLRRALVNPPAVRFDTILECCNKNAFCGQQTQIELALDAVYSYKVSSKGELSTLLTQHEEDAQDAAVEPDRDHPRLKDKDMDTEQHTAYLRRYVRRNANNPTRTQAAMALIEYRQRELFSPEQDFVIHRVDVVEPGVLHITQGGVSKRVREAEVSGHPTSRPRWLRWKARAAKRMQELENKHSEKNPSVVE